jgi:hypothetical protein
MSNERQYYEDIGYKPFLFFIVFGVSGDELEISRAKHNVDEIPEGLDSVSLTRPEHSDYLDGFFSGDLDKVLKSHTDSALYEACKTADKVVVMRGEIAKDDTLDYMRNVIGICQAFIDKGAVGIFDTQTFRIYSPEEWTEKFFGKDVNAQNHVLIMFSEEEDGYWIHTRGMAEFGRPDYGISKVPEDKLEDYKQIIDQMIFYGGQGLVFKGSAKLHTFNGKTFRVATEFVNDFENFDYNNAYYNVTVVEEL